MADDLSDDRAGARHDGRSSAVVSELLALVQLDSGADDDGADAYGAGLQEQGYADYRGAPIPARLRRLVEAAQPAMIRAGEWEALGIEQAESAEKAFAELAAQDSVIAFRQIVLAGLEPGARPGPGGAGRPVAARGGRANRRIAPVDIGAMDPEATAQWARVKEAQQSLDSARAAKQMSKGQAALALRLADHPRNNPERRQIAVALARLEQAPVNASPKARAAARFESLGALQASLFAWNDRRARENLPPAAEAVALGDLVQKMQREVTKDLMARGDDLPLPDGVDTQQAAAAQLAWKNLVASRDPQVRHSPGNRLAVPMPAVGTRLLDEHGMDTGKTLSAEEAEQFTVDMLSNFAQLMQTDAGRSLVGKINDGNHQVVVSPGATPQAGKGDARYMEAHKRKGEGAPSAVKMPPGVKDSDMMLETAHGNVLTAPQPIILGHELIHALHNSRGTNRRDKDLDAMPAQEKQLWAAGGMAIRQWSNPEEYQTIFKGKMSEQLLRAQAGLSAVRHGHATIVDQQGKITSQAVKSGFAQVIDEYAQVEEINSGDFGEADTSLDRKLVAARLDPSAFSDRQKLALVQLGVKGPLPAGWPAAQLSAEQVKVIAQRQLPHATFAKLGWSPFDVPADRLALYIESQAFAERSPASVAYRSLGGDEAFECLSDLVAETRARMPALPRDHLGGPLAGICTAAKLRALQAASAELNVFTQAAGDELVLPANRVVPTRGNLCKRAPMATDAWRKGRDEVRTLLAPAEVDRTRGADKVADKAAVDGMVEALKRVGDAVGAGPGTVASYGLDDAISKARLAIESCRSGKRGHAKELETQRNLADRFAGHLGVIERRVASIRSRALNAYATSTRALLDKSITPQGHRAQLESLMRTPHLQQNLQERLINDLKALAT